MNWDYIAGFFDGEGTVYFAIRPKQGNSVVLSFSNTVREPLVEMARFMGYPESKVHLQLRKRYNPKWADAYFLRFTERNECYWIASELSNRTIIKKAKLQEFIHFIETHAWKWRKLWKVSPERLRFWYVEQGLSIYKIASMTNTCPSVISRWLKRFSILTRKRGPVKGSHHLVSM